MRQEDENRAEIVKRAIEAIERKLDTSEMKPSIADLIRLLQLQRELEPERVREVNVKWVDSD
ncbi:MAG: hypothetical protein U0Q18_19920 [Bryobacteraceae bacterium]